jgi:cytochrome c
MKSTLISALIFSLAIIPACKGKDQQTARRSQYTMNKQEASMVTIASKDDQLSKPDTSISKPSAKAKADTTKTMVKSTWLSPDKGIGPIKELKLSPIDTSMVTKGHAIFQSQCIVCHTLDSKKIGPALRTITNDRPPEFIMNMILNTDQMEKKNPEVKKLISQYGTYMSVLDFKQDQARQILEYLRWESTQPPLKK